MSATPLCHAGQQVLLLAMFQRDHLAGIVLSPIR